MLHIIEQCSAGTTERKMAINRKQALSFELTLNVSEHGHAWNSIGDELFNFMSSSSSDDTEIYVTKEQFDYLLECNRLFMSRMER